MKRSLWLLRRPRRRRGGRGGLASARTRALRTGGGVDVGTLPRGVSRDRLNLVIVTLDTTRADRIGAYGSHDVETPAIDRLAAEGVLFEQAVSVAPLTLPAHSSIFTGKFPPEHGVRDNGGFFLGPEQVTLAEVLKGRGYRTGGFVAAYVLASQVGHQPGLRHLLRRLRSQPGARRLACRRSSGRPTRSSTRRCRGSNRQADRRSSPGFTSTIRTLPTGRPSRSRRDTRGTPTTARSRSPTVRSAGSSRTLQSRGLYDRTVVVVMGDHGESLGDHGEGAHGFFVYNSVTHVPFVIRTPFSQIGASPGCRSGAIGGRHADGARPARSSSPRPASPASASCR